MIVFSACDITNYVALLCTQPCETCILQNSLPSLRFEACWHAGFVLVQQDQNYFNEIHFLKRKKLIPSWFHGSWSYGKLISQELTSWKLISWKLISWQVDLMASWSYGKLIWWQVDLTRVDLMASWSGGKLIWWLALSPGSPLALTFLYIVGERGEPGNEASNWLRLRRSCLSNYLWAT